MIKEVENTIPWTDVISDLNGEKIVGTFYEKNYKKRINKDKLYVKWKGYDIIKC